MYQNNFMLDKLSRQRDEIDNLMRMYQGQPPMNVFNVGNSTPLEFEARFIDKEEKPSEIIVQRRTAFISLDNAKLTIKELNGDIKEYDIIIPKTPEQLENEELRKKVKDLEEQLKERGKDKWI